MSIEFRELIAHARKPRAAVLVAACTIVSVPLAASAATTEELEARLQALAQQVESLKGEVATLRQQNAGLAAQTTVAAPVDASPLPTQPMQSAAGVESAAANPNLFGYGELSYTNPRGDNGDATADLGRFVLGVGYRFDEKTRLVSEVEIEHAIASSEDPGEVEVEQAYIERDLGAGISAKGGLFLIPSGMLNESHEPTRYYGVFRNFVETSIIPSTWREGGVALRGDTAGGLRWDVGLTTGFDLSKWDPASEEGFESPLGSIHQELVLAKAEDLSGFVALNYTGIAALRLGGSIFSGGASQNQPGVPGSDITLWEGHARWTPGNWDLSALYAHGHISGTRDLNLTFVGNPVLVPEDFFGWYAQGAYRAVARDTWSLAPFVRYERINTASSYADIGAGLTPSSPDDQSIWTAGVNLLLGTGVVIKADYVDFEDGAEGDRFDLGLGFAF